MSHPDRNKNNVSASDSDLLYARTQYSYPSHLSSPWHAVPSHQCTPFLPHGRL